VVTTIRLYYDAAVAVALTTVFSIVVALIAAVIVGSNAPNVSVAVIVFALTGPILLFRLRRSWPKSAMHDRTHLRAARWAGTER
jgi:ABC-type transport system involved in cytochrome c biogenesis permease component